MTTTEKPDPGPEDEPRPAPATLRYAPGITDEQRAVMDEYSRKFGEALANNLNANVLAENPDKPAEP